MAFSSTSASTYACSTPTDEPPPYDSVVEDIHPVVTTTITSASTSASTYTRSTSTDELPPYDSAVGDLHRVGNFTFVDFVPQPKEEFGLLVCKANSWLRASPGWDLITCESVEFASKGRSVDSEAMFYAILEDIPSLYFRGLRLWIRERNNSNNAKQIGYVNLIPKLTVPGGMFSSPKFESLQELIARFNSMNKKNPIPGRILTVETQEIQTHNWKIINADQSKWCQQGDWTLYYVYIIRIFYEIMPSEPQEIGLADFLPDTLESGGMFKIPKYEPFSNVVRKASDWLVMQSGIRFCNAQSLEFKIKKGDIDTNRMFYVAPGVGATWFARILRLAYVKSSQSNIDSSMPSSIRKLVCKTFVPVQLKQGVCHVKFESLSKTKERVSAWIKATGAHVVSAGTATLQFRSHVKAKQGPEASFSYNVTQGSERRVFTIILYLNGDYQEPPPETLPFVPETVKSDCCVM